MKTFVTPIAQKAYAAMVAKNEESIRCILSEVGNYRGTDKHLSTYIVAQEMSATLHCAAVEKASQIDQAERKMLGEMSLIANEMERE